MHVVLVFIPAASIESEASDTVLFCPRKWLKSYKRLSGNSDSEGLYFTGRLRDSTPDALPAVGRL
jgi:hypothetical protein